MRVSRKGTSKTSVKRCFRRPDGSGWGELTLPRAIFAVCEGGNLPRVFVGCCRNSHGRLRIVDKRVHAGVARGFLQVFEFSALLIELQLHFG